MRILKQSFQALGSIIGGVLINVLKPFVAGMNVLMQKIIQFARIISNALGKIFGWKYEESGGGMTTDFEDAEDAAGGIADSTGKTAENVKKIQKGLRAFDELKVINLPDEDKKESGSGGGVGGGSSDSGEWTKGESILKDYESEINSLYELGEKIGQTLTNAMNKIDWNKTYQSAKNWGKGLANFLNGLISPELFGATGRTMASSLNTALYFLNSFGKTFDWKDFGNSIATGINEFFKTFDFKNAADTINVWLRGVLKTVSTRLKNTDFEMIGKKIGEFLRTLDLSGILKDIAENLWLALKSAFGLLKGLIKEAPLETALITAFALFKWTRLGSYVATKISTTLATALAARLGLTGTFTTVGSVFATTLGTALTTALASVGGIGGLLTMNMGLILGAGTVAEIGLLVGASIIGGITAAIGGFSLGQLLYEIFSGEEIDMSWAEQFTEIKNSFSDGSWKTALGLWKDDIYDAFLDIGTKEQDFVKGFISVIKNGFNTAKTKAITATKELLTKIKPIWENIKEQIILIVDKIKNTISTKWGEIKSSISTKLSEIKSNISTKWDEIKTNIGLKIDLIKTDAKTRWDAIKKTIIDVVKDLKKDIDDYFDKIKNKISETLGGAKTVVDNFKTAINNAISAIKDFFTQSNKTFKVTLPTTIFENFKNTIGNVVTKLKEMFGYNGKKLEVDASSTNTKKSADTTKTTKTVKQYATGGFPTIGQLFVAREAGPEMVGTLGGKTAVANNDQIANGFAQAIYPAIYNAVSSAMSNFGGNTSVNITLEGDAEGLFNVVQKQANNYMNRTGNPAFI